MKNTFHWPLEIPLRLFLLALISILIFQNNLFAGVNQVRDKGFEAKPDSIIADSTKHKNSLKFKINDNLWRKVQRLSVTNDSLKFEDLRKSPFISLQQNLKGNVAGVYIQETAGEPGTMQNIFIRGLSSPVFSNKNLSASQPIVYINGIPVIGDHPFTYDIKQHDTNPIGSANNILAGIDFNNVKSIEVIKDPIQLAKLGPLASNGAIWITTNDGYYGGKNVTINTSLGMVIPPNNIDPVNATYERNFRQKFYDTYNIPVSDQYYPSYFHDYTDANYYGKADWADSYYRYAPQYNVNASMAGGNAVANYLFTAGATRNAGVTDETSYSKYNIGFYLNMSPIRGLNFSTMITGAKADRNRNKNLRDKYAEMEYLPDITTPIGPNGDTYNSYLSQYDETVDNNTSNLLNGYLKVDYKKDKAHFGVNLLFDYNTNIRHLFLPSTLTESMSFISDYSGYNRRIAGSSFAEYAILLDKKHLINARWDGVINADAHHYNYTKAYDGDNDKYKTTKTGDYRMYRYIDEEQSRIASTSVTLQYAFRKILSLSALFRYDGASNIQSDNRWLFTPAFSTNWNIRNQFFHQSDIVSDMSLGISWARIGKPVGLDRFSLGPNYSSENLNWSGQSVISSYNLFATITRPYSYGWNGYDLNWPYTDKLNIELKGAFFNNKLNLNLSLYNNNDKDMILPVPIPLEYGYQYQYLNGMDVNNKGIDINISADILSNPRGLSWNASFNMNYNRNELKRLPNGKNEMVIGDRKLKVGHAIDQFWVLKNQGIYNNDNEIPSSNGKSLSFGDIAFRKGDPIWTDQNGDYIINDDDKVLTGHSMPPFTGGLTNMFEYKNFDLSFHLFFALGHKALNTRASQRYNFMNLDNQNSLVSVKEIFFWQSTYDNNDYPVYNPLSDVQPYRYDQDLFLESLSYLKLKSLTLGYTFSIKSNSKKGVANSFNDLYVYLTANNLFTITDFSGEDPELTESYGYYTGYSQTIPRSLTLGLRFKF
jgi:TonB-linked SusC/RagA family outer membrane protein